MSFKQITICVSKLIYSTVFLWRMSLWAFIQRNSLRLLPVFLLRRGINGRVLQGMWHLACSSRLSRCRNVSRADADVVWPESAAADWAVRTITNLKGSASSSAQLTSPCLTPLHVVCMDACLSAVCCADPEQVDSCHLPEVSPLQLLLLMWTLDCTMIVSYLSDA